jgi:hypothetical protein
MGDGSGYDAPMRYRLRTLLVLMGIGPPILALGYSIRGTRFFGEFVLWLPLLAMLLCLLICTWQYMLAADGYRKH